jgi:signal transduction histidine kinase
MNQRKNIYLIFKEALNNAVKYPGATRISVHAKYDSKKLELKIEDNGRGFSLQSNNKGNGLLNMRNRAKELNGELLINSDHGTTIQLVMPVS